MPRLICCTRELPDGNKAKYFKSVAVRSEACRLQRGMAVARSCVQLRKCHLPGLLPACSAGLAKKALHRTGKKVGATTAAAWERAAVDLSMARPAEII